MTKNILALLLSLLVLGGCQTARPPAAPFAGATDGGADIFWPKAGIFPGKGTISSWPGFKAKNAQRRTLFAQREAAERASIVFVGDSITEGWQTLSQDFADLGIKVANRGISGDTTPNLLHRLQDDILSLQPRALVVLIGTNDVAEYTPPADISANLKELHKRMRAAYPKIPIAWCLVMPRGNPDLLAAVQEVNAQIRDLVRRDTRITLVDTYTPLALPDGTAKPEDFVPDLLHLNDAGYAVFRDAVHPIVAGWNLSREAK